MKVILKKRLFLCLVVCFICFATVSLVLVACQQSMQEDGENTPSGDADAGTDVKDEVLEAKILYYETQLQGLTTQLDAMEQQMYLMRKDYLDQIELMEQRFNEQAPKEDETPTDTDTSENTGTEDKAPNTKEDAPTGGGEVQLREYTYLLENNFAILTSYLGDKTDVVVPAAVDGHLVIGLADRTFENSNVKSITLPDTIEKIGWFTFYQCENLEKIVLPRRLSSIGYASFDGCAPALCLYVKTGSYAQQFANSFGLRYEESE